MIQIPGRRNVLLLALSQMLMMSAVVLSMTLAAILGGQLASDKGLATLPVAAMVIGTALFSTPASLFMRSFGRRAGFLLGAAIGVVGSAVSVVALLHESFALFVVGHLLIGAYQGFANYYRFAAVEVAGQTHASRAIAWVIAAGVVAAFAGPQIATAGRDWFTEAAFVGSYAAQAALSIVALATILQLRLSTRPTAIGGPARPLREIAGQPAFRGAVFGATVGYAAMIMAMTATPLAMLGCGLSTADVRPVIQWHVASMFAPSFVTGSLVARYGAPCVMQVGFALSLTHVAIAISGDAWIQFLSALVFLGLGWNLAFIGGTSLLTHTYRPSEQTKVQALNESIVFGSVAVASLGAGWLYDRFGWLMLNLALTPLLLAGLVGSILVERPGRSSTSLKPP